MSFDFMNMGLTLGDLDRLNPFGTGQCLSTYEVEDEGRFVRLNPFGTGQCLSTAVGC